MQNNQNQIIISTDHREVELLEKSHKLSLQKLFTGEGIDFLIKEINQQVADFKADISTKKGQAEIKSMAAKVAKCKTPIKNLAMELKDDSRKFIDSVNQQWNRYEAAMDELRDKIRKPVDEIEEKEAALLKMRQDRLAEIERLCATRAFDNVEGVKDLLNDLEIAFDFDNWGEFEFKAKSTYEQAKQNLQSELEKGLKYEAEQAELAKLRAEAAERAKKDHEEKIAREAAEKTKLEAVEREKKIAEEKRLAELAKINAENRAKEAERLAKEQAEIAEQNSIIEKRKGDMFALGLMKNPITSDFIFGGDDNDIVITTSIFLQKISNEEWLKLLERVASDVEKVLRKRKIEAEKKAKEDAKKAAQEAVEKERLRVEAEKEVERKANEKREANKRHRAKIKKEILTAFYNHFTEEESEEIFNLIESGEIPHIQINY